MPVSTNPSRHRVLVVGAGAAGLWAAERAARTQAEVGGEVNVTVLEKTGRTGTKLLASGGTHCNLTTTLEPDETAKLFGRVAERFLPPAFWNLPPLLLREHFHALGVETVEATLETALPKSNKARDVRDALERAARAAGVRFEFDVRVTAAPRREVDPDSAAPGAPSGRTVLWLKCAVTGKPVPALGVRAAVGGRVEDIDSELDGSVVLPPFADDSEIRLFMKSSFAGNREARLLDPSDATLANCMG
jgi:predicted flavoprotein YhiN